MSQILAKHFTKSGMSYPQWDSIRGEWNRSSIPPVAGVCWWKWGVLPVPSILLSSLPQSHGGGILPELLTVNGPHAWCRKCLIMWITGTDSALSQCWPFWVLSGSVYSYIKPLTCIVINDPALLRLFIISINEFFLLQQIFPSCSYLEL